MILQNVDLQQTKSKKAIHPSIHPSISSFIQKGPPLRIEVTMQKRQTTTKQKNKSPIVHLHMFCFLLNIIIPMFRVPNTNPMVVILNSPESSIFFIICSFVIIIQVIQIIQYKQCIFFFFLFLFEVKKDREKWE